MSILRRDRPPPILAPDAVRVAPRPEPSGPTPEEELPDWVMSSVLRFMEPFFASRGPASYGFGPGYGYTEASPRNFVMEIERTCQIPIPWQNGPNGAANAVWQAMYRDRALAVRVLDYALGEVMLGDRLASLGGGAVVERSRAIWKGAVATNARPGRTLDRQRAQPNSRRASLPKRFHTPSWDGSWGADASLPRSSKAPCLQGI